MPIVLYQWNLDGGNIYIVVNLLLRSEFKINATFKQSSLTVYVRIVLEPVPGCIAGAGNTPTNLRVSVHVDSSLLHIRTQKS